jgi:hypothetical protein
LTQLFQIKGIVNSLPQAASDEDKQKALETIEPFFKSLRVAMDEYTKATTPEGKTSFLLCSIFQDQKVCLLLVLLCLLVPLHIKENY